MDRLRFPAPLPVGAGSAARARSGGVRGQGRSAGEGGVHARGQGLAKPALVAECLFRYYDDGWTGRSRSSPARAGLGRAYAEALARAGAAVVVNDVDGDAARRPSRRRAAASPRSCAVGAGRGGRRAGGAAVERVRAARRAGHQRRRPARPGAVEDDRRGLRRRRRRCTCAARSPAPARPRSGCGSRARAAGSSWSARRPASAGTSARPTTPPPRPASRRWRVRGRWSCARSGITVNAVVPVAATEMTKTIPAFEPLIEESRPASRCPAWLRRDEGLGTAEDAAGLVVFLASDAARGITGQAIGIGGDRLALWSHPARGRWPSPMAGGAPRRSPRHGRGGRRGAGDIRDPGAQGSGGVNGRRGTRRDRRAHARRAPARRGTCR